MTSEYYTKCFFERMRNGATRSAEIMLPLVLQLLPVSSVVDVGCGEGNWLSVFRKLGVIDVLGIDGDYVDSALLQIPQNQFQAADLEKPLHLARNFDLAISLEVAEHLPADCAPVFVESLVDLAPVVLFSAAIPFQGGNHHINEEWPDEWAELFKSHDYVPIDFIRKQIWQNEAVEWWYAQNTLLFARADLVEGNPSLKAECQQTHLNQLSLVHPRLFQQVQVQRKLIPGVKEASRQLFASLKNSIVFRLQRNSSGKG